MRGPHLVILWPSQRGGQVFREPVEMLADDLADFLSGRAPVPRVRWCPARPARHARQRRHAERPVLGREQLGPRSQVGEELVEHPVQGLRPGDPAGCLPDVQERVNDLVEHLVEGGRRILAPGRAHRSTRAGRWPAYRPGQAFDYAIPRRASLSLTQDCSAGPARLGPPGEQTNRSWTEPTEAGAFRAAVPCPGHARGR